MGFVVQSSQVRGGARACAAHPAVADWPSTVADSFLASNGPMGGGVLAAKTRYDAFMAANKRGRPPSATVGPATARVTVRMTPQLLAVLDRVRGSSSRAAFLRECVRERARAGGGARGGG